MKSITVFCGSSIGNKEIFVAQAILLGEALAKRRIRLVYGGAKIGLMGAIANGALNAGGEVIGVLPKFLQEKESAHENLTELIIVNSMHERKLKMNELSDGVIGMPGGYGTVEEFFEMITWSQLGLHDKPVALFNIDGFYDSIKLLTKTMVENGFLKKSSEDMLILGDNIDELLLKMENFISPRFDRFVTPDRV